MLKLLSPLILGIVLIALSRPSVAQTALEQQLKAVYEGQTLLLRNFYSGEEMKFDEQGRLLEGGTPVDWTLGGKVLIEKLTLRTEKLEIEGERLFLVYESKANDFKVEHKEKVAIEIAADDQSENGAYLKNALERIFGKPEALADMAPTYWRAFLTHTRPTYATDDFVFMSSRIDEKEFFEAAIPQAALETAGGAQILREMNCDQLDQLLKKNGPRRGKWRNGRTLRAPDPSYTEAARKAHLQGRVVLFIVIDIYGRVANVQIVQPIGLGLDEAAVAKIQEWKFEPVSLNGNPMADVQLVSVDFKLQNAR